MLINNRYGENVFQIKYKVEYKTFFMAALHLQTLPFIFCFMFLGIVLLLKVPAIH